MRTLVLWICVFGVSAGICAAQSKMKQIPVRFDPPLIVSSVEAAYPIQSVASGTVVLEVSIDENAKITNVRVVHGIPSLTEPAELSVKQWKFAPARLDGKPVPSKIAVAFSFVPPNVGPRV